MGGRPELQPYLDCFNLLRVLLTIFERSNFEDIATAKDSMQTHHIATARLYPRSLEMKIHGQVHIIDFWEYWKVLLSCFGPERHHLIMKRCMSFSYRKSCNTALAYDTRIWFQNLKSANLSQPMHLAGNIHAANREVNWPGMDATMLFTTYSCNLQTERGMLQKHDLLQWGDAGSTQVGIAIGFASTNNVAIPYVAFIHACLPAVAGAWRTQVHQVTLLDAAVIVGSVPYLKQADIVMPLLHAC